MRVGRLTLGGRRMLPDILVRDQNGRMVCVVEIGNTRPEKLIACHDDLEIPDVRWYAFEGWCVCIHQLKPNLDRAIIKFVEAMRGASSAERTDVLTRLANTWELSSAERAKMGLSSVDPQADSQAESSAPRSNGAPLAA
jgi:hypothetical protein